MIALLESARRADLIEAIFPRTRAGRAAARAYLARVGSQPGLQYPALVAKNVGAFLG